MGVVKLRDYEQRIDALFRRVNCGDQGVFLPIKEDGKGFKVFYSSHSDGWRRISVAMYTKESMKLFPAGIATPALQLEITNDAERRIEMMADQIVPTPFLYIPFPKGEDYILMRENEGEVDGEIVELAWYGGKNHPISEYVQGTCTPRLTEEFQTGRWESRDMNWHLINEQEGGIPGAIVTGVEVVLQKLLPTN